MALVIFPLMALASGTDTSVIYHADPKPLQIIQKEPVTNRDIYLPLAIDAAKEKGIEPEKLICIVDHEDPEWDPQRQSDVRYSFSDPKRGIKEGDREMSFSFGQWHVPDNKDISYEEIYSPEWNFNKIAEEIKNGNAHWRWKYTWKKCKDV